MSSPVASSSSASITHSTASASASHSSHPTFSPPQRRPSHSASTLAHVDQPQPPPARWLGAIVKHGKYILAGTAGMWWLDLSSATTHILESGHGWSRRLLVAALGFHGMTVVIFLYLVLFLPWFRGYIPNYPKWQQSARLRVLVPLLTTTILLGWTSLVVSLTHAGHPTPRGAIRDAIRGSMGRGEVDTDDPGLGVFGSMAGATAVYTLTFGVLGFIPSPNVPVRVKKA